MVDLSNIHDYGDGPYPDIPEEVFAEIGCRLVLLQDLELMITFVAKVVFEIDHTKARESILNSDKKTMGQLIKILREKVHIHEDFDSTLKRTLDARNFFVHDISHKFNLRSKNGLAGAITFLSQSMDDLEEVTQTMKAVVVSCGRERGMNDVNWEENWRKYGDLEQIEEVYIPNVSKTFRKKN